MLLTGTLCFAGIIAFRQQLKDRGRARGMQEIRLQEIREVANLQQQNPTSLTTEQIQHLQELHSNYLQKSGSKQMSLDEPPAVPPPKGYMGRKRLSLPAGM